MVPATELPGPAREMPKEALGATGAESVQRAVPLLSDELQQLIEDLRDDGVERNALRAVPKLRKAWPESQPYLERGLQSQDAQQRLLCAYLLMDKSAPPSPRLLEVAVESLRDDQLPYGYHWSGERSFIYAHNGRMASSYLSRHPAQARPYLLDGFRGRERQCRQLCAGLLARQPDQGLHADLIAYFRPQLYNNHIAGDAADACRALLAIGEQSLPGLRSLARSWDPQAARLSAAWIEQIEGHHDPAISFEKHDLEGVIARRTLVKYR